MEIQPPPDLPTDEAAREATIAGYCAQLRGSEAFRWFIGWVSQQITSDSETALSDAVIRKIRRKARARRNALVEVRQFVPDREDSAKAAIERAALRRLDGGKSSF